MFTFKTNLKSPNYKLINIDFKDYQMVRDLGPVVQNFVSLTLSLSPQFVNCILTSKANTLLFFVEKM